MEKGIRFINSNYKTLFTIPDGGKIKFTNGHSGEVKECTCKYIDDYHFYFDTLFFHICQFAEMCERNGHKAEPIE